MNKPHIPKSISQRLASYHLANLSPAWVELAPNTEQIKSIGGKWQAYFTKQPKVNTNISDYCDTLQGMLPIEYAFELPHMQLKDNTYTDIIAFEDVSGGWLLFLDVTNNVLELQQYQQAANELHLLKGQLDRTLSRHIGHEIAQLAVDGDIQLNTEGERKIISTLFVDIRGFTNYNEKVDAQEVMNTLNAYMHEMLQSILDNHGIIDKIMGDGIMAIFGIAASNNNHVEDVFQAGLTIQQRIKALNEKRAQRQQEVLGVGVGIATGEAVLGILGSHERRAFTAIGKHVNLAARLESNARAGEILLDEVTLNALEKTPHHRRVNLELKGIGKVDVYTVVLD
ncbi:MAG TPA: adenylate/guanylate cyclase domain-containing protein [Ghiorsea sp.]|nr:adenylate/guanylate cyclase domain-containing protein [Ghiorsea sp.]HIP07289.1 adenylate/guanylate cyclase domain-containing protein [Mariprofundaceae bacterium]